MDYTEFLIAARDALKAKELWWGNEYLTVIDKRWQTGGSKGANCYGDNPYPAEVESEPEFIELDIVLEIVAPNITYMQYKELVRTVLEHKESSESDFYGNYTNSQAVSADLSKLYTWLDAKGVLAP